MKNLEIKDVDNELKLKKKNTLKSTKKPRSNRLDC